MRKVWVTVRKNIPGHYVEWYDDANRRRSKYFGPEYRKHIKAFMARKFAELNADVRPVGSVIDVSWQSCKEQYLKQKRIEGVAAASYADIEDTLALFDEYCCVTTTGQINQRTLQDFILALQARASTRLDQAKTTDEEKVYRKLSPNTINKHLRNLRALLAWGAKLKFIAELEVKSVKAQAKPIRILSDTEIKNLLIACGDDRQWRLRVLLAVCTGLRRQDIGNLKHNDIDIERKTVSIINQKTGKPTNYQPLPDALMPEIEKFLLDEVKDKQVKLFRTGFTKKWNTIRKRAGVPDIQFHDLRRTFGSMQADAGVPIKALQEMYNHSSIETTMKHYIKTADSEKRDGVNKLRVKEWL